MAERSNTSSGIDIRMMDDTTLAIVYRGDITADMIDSVFANAKRTLAGRTEVTGWLIDTLDASSFAFAPTDSIRSVFNLWKTHGGKRFAVVSSAGFIKMMGTALRFAKVGPVQVFDTQAQALKFLHGP